jgi:hypothetical protein
MKYISFNSKEIKEMQLNSTLKDKELKMLARWYLGNETKDLIYKKIDLFRSNH